LLQFILAALYVNSANKPQLNCACIFVGLEEQTFSMGGRHA